MTSWDPNVDWAGLRKPIFEPDIEVDYGTFTPETLDRFGTNQTWMIQDRESRRDLTVGNFRGRVKRLGLTLLYWRRHPYHQTEIYRLDLNGRTVEIRSYVDGRVQLLVDQQSVYLEEMKTITRNWVKTKSLLRHHWGDDEERELMEQLHTIALLENVRFDQERRRQEINTRKE